MNKIIAFLLLLASVAVAQPTYDITADVNYPDRPLQPLTFLQGSTPSMRVYIEQAGSTFTDIASDSLVFYYGTSGNASSYVQVTNASVTAASGYFTVNFTAAQLNTNGSFWYTVLLKDSGTGIYYSGDGELEIKKTTVTGSPGALTLTTPLDWQPYTFSNPDSAPMVVDGSTVTGVTNASGQVTITAVAASVPFADITGAATSNASLNTELTNRYTKAETDATFFPFSGGTITGDVDIQARITSIDSMQFDLAYTNGIAEGLLQWNDDAGTLDLGMPGGTVNLQIGQEHLVRVKNVGATIITNGKAIAIAPNTGSRPGVVLADGDAGDYTAICSGISTEDIGINDTGFINILGLVRGVDTTAWTEGAELYLSTTAGELTTTIPTYPVDARVVGTVNASSVDGSILVRPSTIKTWAELDAVYATYAQGALADSALQTLVGLSNTNASQVVTILDGTQAGYFAEDGSGVLGLKAYLGTTLEAGKFVSDQGTVRLAAQTGAVVQVTGDIAVSGTVDGQDIAGSIDQAVKTTSSPTFDAITVDKVFFANGGTNSWLTMSSATSGVWRINGSNTIFNVTLGQE